MRGRVKGGYSRATTERAVRDASALLAGRPSTDSRSGGGGTATADGAAAGGAGTVPLLPPLPHRALGPLLLPILLPAMAVTAPGIAYLAHAGSRVEVEMDRAQPTSA
ncbi:hypothetical protein KM043_002536 [Ampulex compressa]|nr:hypothetical protein KM043_002536 [Ampulex compressa]